MRLLSSWRIRAGWLYPCCVPHSSVRMQGPPSNSNTHVRACYVAMRGPQRVVHSGRLVGRWCQQGQTRTEQTHCGRPVSSAIHTVCILSPLQLALLSSSVARSRFAQAMCRHQSHHTTQHRPHYTWPPSESVSSHERARTRHLRAWQLTRGGATHNITACCTAVVHSTGRRPRSCWLCAGCVLAVCWLCAGSVRADE